MSTANPRERRCWIPDLAQLHIAVGPGANQRFMEIRMERNFDIIYFTSVSSHRIDGETEVQGKVMASLESKQIN